jgi:topoisomerase-4 subunit A
MADELILDGPPPVGAIKLKDALEERYIAYALSTIKARALPDVRDGLKTAPGASSSRCASSGSIPTPGFKKRGA